MTFSRFSALQSFGPVRIDRVKAPSRLPGVYPPIWWCAEIHRKWGFSMDWFKGKFTGKHHIWWENPWFPVDFPLNQSIEILNLEWLINMQGKPVSGSVTGKLPPTRNWTYWVLAISEASSSFSFHPCEVDSWWWVRLWSKIHCWQGCRTQAVFFYSRPLKSSGCGFSRSREWLCTKQGQIAQWSPRNSTEICLKQEY